MICGSNLKGFSFQVCL